MLNVGLTAIYLFWLFGHAVGLGWALVAGEALMASTMFLFAANTWTQRSVPRWVAHRARGSVDVFIPTADEPLDVIERTVAAAVALRSRSSKVYVLDDAGRPDVETLTGAYGAIYQTRTERRHGKAGNLNAALRITDGDFILVLDADQVPHRQIIRDLLGHFGEDPSIAFVTTRQSFDIPRKDFGHDLLFYEYMQPSRNACGVPVSTGSGVIYRRTALDAIGGFQTWNVLEDLYTSYVLHARGFQSIYVNRAYARGSAPTDLSAIVLQRSKWGVDSLRMLLWRCPLWQPGLKIRQRIQYLELGWTYLTSALGVPILLLLPALSIVLGEPLVDEWHGYAVLRPAAFAASFWLYYSRCGRRASEMQMWVSLSPVYLRALAIAAFGAPVRWGVTPKIHHQGGDRLVFVAPHLGILAVNVGVLMLGLCAWSTPGSVLMTNAAWTGVAVAWFWPVLRKACAPTKVRRQKWIGATRATNARSSRLRRSVHA